MLKKYTKYAATAFAVASLSTFMIGCGEAAVEGDGHARNPRLLADVPQAIAVSVLEGGAIDGRELHIASEDVAEVDGVGLVKGRHV